MSNHPLHSSMAYWQRSTYAPCQKEVRRPRLLRIFAARLCRRDPCRFSVCKGFVYCSLRRHTTRCSRDPMSLTTYRRRGTSAHEKPVRSTRPARHCSCFFRWRRQSQQAIYKDRVSLSSHPWVNSSPLPTVSCRYCPRNLRRDGDLAIQRNSPLRPCASPVVVEHQN